MASDPAVPAGDTGTGGPIFIVGAMGSGTTLIRLMLDSHEHIAIAQETGFMRAVSAQTQIPFWKFGAEWFGRLGWSDEEFAAELGAFYNGLFMRFAQEQGKQRWGDKTPYHTWHMPEAARIFADAKFIAIVRHPGAVASSLHDRFKYEWPQAVNHWVRSNLELLHRAPELGDRLVVCRYEDMVLDPEPTMREVLGWLDEPWSPRVLEHHVVHSERGTPAKVEGSTRSDEPIDVSRISKWTERMDPEGYRVLRQRATKLSKFFGYTVDHASTMEPLFPTTTERVRLLTGHDLAERLAPLGPKPYGEWPRQSLANRPLNPRDLTVMTVATAEKVKAVEGTGPAESKDAAKGEGKGGGKAKAQGGKNDVVVPAQELGVGASAAQFGRAAGKAVVDRLPAETQQRVRDLVTKKLPAARRS